LFDDYVVNHYKKIVEFSKERGFIRNAFDVKQWIDKSYLEKALKDSGLENYWQLTDIHGNPVSQGRTETNK
jgi:sulfonate transport system substrate-binding protein